MKEASAITISSTRIGLFLGGGVCGSIIKLNQGQLSRHHCSAFLYGGIKRKPETTVESVYMTRKM